MSEANQLERRIAAVCCVLLLAVFAGFMANYPRQGWTGGHVAAAVVMAWLFVGAMLASIRADAPQASVLAPTPPERGPGSHS